MSKLQLLKSSRKAKALLVGVIVLILGVVSTFTLTFYADAQHPYTIRNYTLQSGDGIQIQSIVYTPADTSTNLPGVVVGHGFCENKQYMQLLSIELVKRGFVVVNIDFRGHGSSDGYLGGIGGSGLYLDMLAGVEYLESLGYVDRIGLAGHSMGGGTSMITALQNPSRINATVAIGALSTFSSYGNLSGVPNLLAAYALYDQGITQEDGLDFLRAYTGYEQVEIGTLYGDFGAGNATKVSVSSNSEHLLEPIDSAIIFEAVQWFEYAFNGAPATDIQLTSQYLITSLLISLIGLLMVLFAFMAFLGDYIFKEIQAPPRAIDEGDKFPIKQVLGYFLAAVIGFILLIPLSAFFVDVAPITMFNSVFAGQVVGLAFGVALAILIFSYKDRKLL
ncbi:MAG: alpha/beta hydrolase family protein, partial [Promethearchaeota archaeon]